MPLPNLSIKSKWHPVAIYRCHYPIYPSNLNDILLLFIDATTQFIHQIQMTEPLDIQLLFIDATTKFIHQIQMTKPQDILLLFLDVISQAIHWI